MSLSKDWTYTNVFLKLTTHQLIKGTIYVYMPINMSVYVDRLQSQYLNIYVWLCVYIFLCIHLLIFEHAYTYTNMHKKK